MTKPPRNCPETVNSHHGLPDQGGRCPYCGRKVAPKQPAPTEYERSNLADAYRRFWVPDWGTDPADSDPL